MFSNLKTPSVSKARKMSEKGSSRRTQTVINDCIRTINRYIEVATEEGTYSTHTWFNNKSGYLTEAAFDKVVKHFTQLGYKVKVKIFPPQDPQYNSIEFQISVNWEKED